MSIPNDTSNGLKSGKSPFEEFLEALRQLIGSIPSEIQEKAKQTFEYKRQRERMLPFFEQLAELSTLEEPLGFGHCIEDDLTAYSNLVGHAKNLWSDACLLFRSRRFAPALFLAIVTMEEIGKIAVAKMQLFTRDQTRKTGDSQNLKMLKRSKNPLYSHTQKHLLAACAGAVVNSRLDRLLGIDSVNSFIADVEAHKVEQLRQRCLYCDLQSGNQHLPYEAISDADAKVYLLLASELLAEVAPLTAANWKEFLVRVETVEKELGLIP